MFSFSLGPQFQHLQEMQEKEIYEHFQDSTKSRELDQFLSCLQGHSDWVKEHQWFVARLVNRKVLISKELASAEKRTEEVFSKALLGADTILDYAIRDGQTEAVRYWMGVGAQPSLGGGKFFSLHWAIAQGHDDVVKYLITDGGVDVDLRSPAGKTLLHAACQKGSADLVKFLIEKGADLSVLTGEGLNVMHLAARRGHKEVVEVLLHHDSQLLYQGDEEGGTPFHYAALEGQIEMCRVLLGRDPDLANVQVEGGASPLFFIAAKKEAKDPEKVVGVAEVLVEYGALIRGMGPIAGYSLLHAAATGGNVALAKFILDREPDLLDGEVEQTGHTPLRTAVSCDHLAMVEFLLQCGASLDKADYMRRTVLHFATCLPNPAITKLLIQRGASLKALDDGGNTPLHYACASGNTVIVIALLGGRSFKDKVLDIIRSPRLLEIRNRLGETPLHLACANGSPKMVKFLIAMFFSITARDNWGRTPLHFAAERGRPDNVQALLADYTSVHGKEELEKYLQMKDREGLTAFESAFLDGREEVVKLLCDKYEQAIPSSPEEWSQLASKATSKRLRNILSFILKMPVSQRRSIVQNMLDADDEAFDVGILHHGFPPFQIGLSLAFSELQERTLARITKLGEEQLRVLLVVAEQLFTEEKFQNLFEQLTSDQVSFAWKFVSKERRPTVLSTCREKALQACQSAPHVQKEIEELRKKIEELQAGDQEKCSKYVSKLRELDNHVRNISAAIKRWMPLGEILEIEKYLKEADAIFFPKEEEQEALAAQIAELGEALAKKKHPEKKGPSEVHQEDEKDVTELLPSIGVTKYGEYEPKLGIQGPELEERGIETGADLRALGISGDFFSAISGILVKSKEKRETGKILEDGEELLKQMREIVKLGGQTEALKKLIEQFEKHLQQVKKDPQEDALRQLQQDDILRRQFLLRLYLQQPGIKDAWEGKPDNVTLATVVKAAELIIPKLFKLKEHNIKQWFSAST